jgi:hypothetical protein
MPCHVVEVAKDFIKIAFETSNGIFTPPIVKIPKGHSQYSREPTQVGDKGTATPGDYYHGGVTGDAGGNTNFYPRGNLTALAFHGLSQVANPDRIVDQLTHMGGPAGWIAQAFIPQKKDQQQQQQNQQSTQAVFVQQARNQRAINLMTQRKIMAKSMGISLQSLLMPSVQDATNAPPTDQTQNSQQGQSNDQTNFNFDKGGIATVQSKDTEHNITVNQSAKKITLNVPANEKVFIGGDGEKGKYARVLTESGPSMNGMARIG